MIVRYWCRLPQGLLSLQSNRLGPFAFSWAVQSVRFLEMRPFS